MLLFPTFFCFPRSKSYTYYSAAIGYPPDNSSTDNYIIHGLEATNNNAFKRYIVLHSYTPMPETEVYPLHLPLGISQGCPVISDEVMRKVDGLLKAEKKPVLLWVYD